MRYRTLRHGSATTTGTTSSSGRRRRRSSGLAEARAFDRVRAVMEVAQADGLELRRPDAHAATDPGQADADLALGRDREAAARLGVLVDAVDGHPREPHDVPAFRRRHGGIVDGERA